MDAAGETSVKGGVLWESGAGWSFRTDRLMRRETPSKLTARYTLYTTLSSDIGGHIFPPRLELAIDLTSLREHCRTCDVCVIGCLLWSIPVSSGFEHSVYLDIEWIMITSSPMQVRWLVFRRILKKDRRI